MPPGTSSQESPRVQLPRSAQPCLHKASSTQHEGMDAMYDGPDGTQEGSEQGYLMRFLSEPSRGRLQLQQSPSNAANVEVGLRMCCQGAEVAPLSVQHSCQRH